MKLLNRMLGHDHWTTGQLLTLCEELSDEQLDREFDFAHRTVRATFVHIIHNLEAWSDCIAGRPIRKKRGESISRLTERLDQASTEFGCLARSIADSDGWDKQWVDPINGTRRSYGGTIAHVITHSMHHRAQLLYMMRMLGIENLPEGDVLSWEHMTSDETSGDVNGSGDNVTTSNDRR